MSSTSSVHSSIKLPTWALLMVCAGLTSACQHAAATSKRIEWLVRNWELQYVLYVDDSWTAQAKAAQERAKEKGPSELDRDWVEIFSPSSVFPSRDKWARPNDGLSVVLIEFDRDGRVRTPNSYGGVLHGRLDRLSYLTLSAGDYAKQPRFNLGEWFMGLGDVSTHWAPGLCGAGEMPSPFSKTDTGYLYGPAFQPSLGSRTFGCREWAYQLGDPGRPYIDITSYFSKKDDPEGSGTYVHPVMGWARFNDDRKPVIGKHEEDWYCFLDCPGGEKPGLIPDITVWAKKNGWAVPKRPTRVPVFPDPPVKSGTYPP